jgi:hypothetical protein
LRDGLTDPGPRNRKSDRDRQPASHLVAPSRT